MSRQYRIDGSPVWMLGNGGGSTFVAEPGPEPRQTVAPGVLETSSRPFGLVASGVERADVPGTATSSTSAPRGAEASRTGFILHEYSKAGSLIGFAHQTPTPFIPHENRKRWPAVKSDAGRKRKMQNCAERPAA